MKLGTKSVLFGAHCFFLHPWFVAAAWFRLYRFRRVKIGEASWVEPAPDGGWRPPIAGVRVTRAVFTSILDPRLWVAFFVHDLGYIGKPNMDGPEGEQHPYLGAHLCGELFGAAWFTFVLTHSRFLAKQLGVQPSALCIADKLATVLTPAWLYLPMVTLTGEVEEYMAHAADPNGKYRGEAKDVGSRRAWYESLRAYMIRWVEEHKDGRPDTWTATPSRTVPSSVPGIVWVEECDAQPARLSGGAH